MCKYFYHLVYYIEFTLVFSAAWVVLRCDVVYCGVVSCTELYCVVSCRVVLCCVVSCVVL